MPPIALSFRDLATKRRASALFNTAKLVIIPLISKHFRNYFSSCPMIVLNVFFTSGTGQDQAALTNKADEGRLCRLPSFFHIFSDSLENNLRSFSVLATNHHAFVRSSYAQALQVVVRRRSVRFGGDIFNTGSGSGSRSLFRRRSEQTV